MPTRLPVKSCQSRQQLLGEELLHLHPAVLVDQRINHLAHVVAAVGLGRDQVRDGFSSAWRPGGGGLRLLARSLWHELEVRARKFDRLFVVCDQRVAAAALGAMHACAAELLEAHLLANHDLDHSRRSQVHRGVALDHDHDVAEGRDVSAARGRRAEQDADLRDLP